MLGEEVKEAEPRCLRCGKNEFKLFRALDSQITAECIHCGEPHFLDAVDDAGNLTILTFWSPKTDKRVVETSPIAYEHEEIQYAPIPEEMKKKSAEDLAKDMMEFLDKEYPRLLEDKRPAVIRLLYPYLKKIGVDTLLFHGNADFRVKIQKAEMIVQKEFEEKRLRKKKQRILELKPKLVEWSKKNGLDKIAQADVEAFLLTNEISLSQEDGRILAKLANLDLKAQ